MWRVYEIIENSKKYFNEKEFLFEKFLNGRSLRDAILELENNNIEIENPKSTDIYIATIGDAAKTKSFKLIKDLRTNHISADNDHLDKSLKAQFKYSDKLNAKYTVVIGDDELANDTATLKNMKTSEQTTIKLSELVDELKKRL